MTTVELIKTMCRVEDLSDAEIMHRIASAKEDMVRTGVPRWAVESESPAVVDCICAHINSNLETDDLNRAEGFLRSYQMQVDQLRKSRKWQEALNV